MISNAGKKKKKCDFKLQVTSCKLINLLNLFQMLHCRFTNLNVQITKEEHLTAGAAVNAEQKHTHNK